MVSILDTQIMKKIDSLLYEKKKCLINEAFFLSDALKFEKQRECIEERLKHLIWVEPRLDLQTERNGGVKTEAERRKSLVLRKPKRLLLLVFQLLASTS